MPSSESVNPRPEIPPCFYLPWSDGENNFEAGITFGKDLARATGLPLQTGMPQLNQIPKDLVKGQHFTERSRGALRSPRVVLLLHPTFKLMSHPLPGEMSHVVVVEFPNSRLNGWAAFAGAFNLTSKEYMSAEVSDEALALYKRIEWNGNNGWADEWGKRDAIRDLGELKRMGELDIDLLRGYMLSKKSHIAIDRLIKLAGHLTQ